MPFRTNRNPWMRIAIAGLLILSAGAAALSQAGLSEADRVGEVAKRLSDRDLADLKSLLPADARPWLLVGYTTMTATKIIEAYLQPEATTGALRRGRLIVLKKVTNAPWTNQDSPQPFNPADGNSQRNGNYAQVALPQRSFDDVLNEDDLNRPFRVEGRFDDGELASLLRFLRSSPAWTNARLANLGFSPTQRSQTGLWPVESVYRTADEVIVWFYFKNYRSRRVHLQQDGQEWTITDLFYVEH